MFIYSIALTYILLPPVISLALMCYDILFHCMHCYIALALTCSSTYIHYLSCHIDDIKQFICKINCFCYHISLTLMCCMPICFVASAVKLLWHCFYNYTFHCPSCYIALTLMCFIPIYFITSVAYCFDINVSCDHMPLPL